MARTPPQPFTQTLTEEGTRAAQELRRDERGAPEGVEGEGNVVSVVIGALRALLWHSMYDRLLASCSLFLCVGLSEGHFACYGSADLVLRACSCAAMTSAYVQSVSPALSSHW